MHARCRLTRLHGPELSLGPGLPAPALHGPMLSGEEQAGGRTGAAQVDLNANVLPGSKPCAATNLE